MKNLYEFREWRTYECWYEVEAKDETEARAKLADMGEEDIRTKKWVGNDGETELYRTTVLDDEPADREETEIGGHVEDKYANVSSQDDIYAHD